MVVKVRQLGSARSSSSCRRLSQSACVTSALVMTSVSSFARRSGIVATQTPPAFITANQQAAIIGLFGPRSSTRLPGLSPISRTSTFAMRFACERVPEFPGQCAIQDLPVAALLVLAQQGFGGSDGIGPPLGDADTTAVFLVQRLLQLVALDPPPVHLSARRRTFGIMLGQAAQHVELLALPFVRSGRLFQLGEPGRAPLAILLLEIRFPASI